MKHRSSLIISMALIFCIFLTGAGSASISRSDPLLPERPERLGGEENTRMLDRSLERHPFLEDERVQPVLSNSLRSPDFDLGDPGLSYRYTGEIGTNGSGYLTDLYHLNAPSGVFIDGSNNFYVVEEYGYRLLRYNAGGTNTLSLGTASYCLERNNPDGFCSPQDVAVDASGNIWLATGNRIVKYSSSGVFQTQLPVPNSNGNWSSGSDSTHFRNASGVAIDTSNNRLFVSDRNNHRIQVYNIASGSPVYAATIGDTGVPGGDNSHFNSPRRIAVDSSGRVYVADRSNNRIQRCNFSGTWTCLPFATGVSVFGVFIDNGGGGSVYFNDQNISGIKKCSQAGACTDIISDYANGRDVAVDSAGNIYYGAFGHAAVMKFNSLGEQQDDFVGEWHVGFFNSTARMFSPWGVAVDSAGNIYGGEYYGYRFYKFNSAGVQQWVVGDPAGWGDEDDQFYNIEGKPAIDAGGNIYAPDSGYPRVKVYTPAGNFVTSFGGYGTGDDQFAYLGGIAISPVNGDIFVADIDNHRVQVFYSDHTYKTTLGETGVDGSDADHFNYPYDVAVDSSGVVYVADAENYRIQKCTLTGMGYSCVTIAGETGVVDEAHNHFYPIGVAVDSAGRIFVVDDWNWRVQVYDSTGAYLATIGGASGSRNSEFRRPSGVALDASGNVYISDLRNNRVQKFAPGVPGWLQRNSNGFGDLFNYNLRALTPFGGALYAGTHNDNGAQLWKMTGEDDWTMVDDTGFGDTDNNGLNDLEEFGGELYAGMRNNTDGAAIYRSSDGSDWSEQVVSGGFDSTDNFGVYRMQVFSGYLYASTGRFDGSEIWRSPSGDSGDWEPVVTVGFDSEWNNVFWSSAVHDGALYFGSQNYDPVTEASSNGGIVIRSTTGADGSWTKVSLNGFGDTNNYFIYGLASFGGYLYASTGRWGWSGTEVWRCQVCDSADDWEQVVDNGFGFPNNWGGSVLQSFNGQLYLVVGNYNDGMEVWSSPSGDAFTWMRGLSGGFGDIINAYPYPSNVTEFDNRLFLATDNWAKGVQVWSLEEEWDPVKNIIFLPTIRR